MTEKTMSDIPVLTTPRHPGRLPAHPSHKINYDSPLEFEFDGKKYTGYAGDTIASALWAAGVRVLSRSFKYHRPRGPFAMTHADSSTLVRVGDEPNVRAGVRRLEAGMVIKSQNAWPSLQADVMSLNRFGSRFMPVGFYYKTFIRPKSLWPVYETFLRHAAGLGHVTPDIPAAAYDKKYEFADVLVIGGGPAGMSAALSAAETGARVLLLDENPYLGGHLAFEQQIVARGDGEPEAAHALAERLAQQVSAQPNIRVELNCTAVGIYNHGWVGAMQADTRLLKIRGRALVIANGAFEQPLIFENSDLPGVILGSMARQLMHRYGVTPGQRAVVLSANDDGLQTALDLNAAGVEIATVAEMRPAVAPELLARLEAANIPLQTNATVMKASGSSTVTGAIVAQIDGEKSAAGGPASPQSGTEAFFRCDLLVCAHGWIPATGLLYQAQAKLAFDETRSEFLPAQLPSKIHAAGRVAGSHSPQAEMVDGQTAGLNAARDAGFGDGASDLLAEQLAGLKAAEPKRTSGYIYVPGGKHTFVSFDEDVSIKDIRAAVAEGYSSMELLKRYSTVSMGPSQGAYESINTMALCAEANGQSIAETGTTTSRPPFTSVPLGVLAGRMMEPVKTTPMHDWHLDRGASMMNAGLWKRPEFYGNPAEEVLATRNSLGIIDVSTLGKLQLHGKDVPQLLERVYTNRWRKLAVGRARYGVVCSEEGVLVDDGVSAHLADDLWYMTATTGGANATYETIEWYQQSGWNLDVRVLNLTDTYAAMNLTGPNARQMLQPLTDVDLSNEAFPYMGARQGTVAGVPAILLRIGFTGELGYELHVPAGFALYLWETLMEAGRDFDITPFGVEAQRIMRLEKGHFIIGQDTDALTDPMMAHMEWAVKLGKPGFLGKPSLVRIKRRGTTQRLVGYQMLNPAVVPEEANQIVVPNPAQPIGLEIIGRVTSARYSPTLQQSIGLCWLPVERSEPGNEFTVRIRGEMHTGKVVPLPFYDAPGERLKS